MTDLSSPATERTLESALVEVMGMRLSTATILFHSAVAERLGLNATDMKCYTLLRQFGPLTAGELAERTGLTTGAITGVIDRLERAGLAQRKRDPDDRRCVVVELVHDPERERAIDQLYAPLGQAISQLVRDYTPAQRAAILDFITRATTILEQETRRLRQMDHASA
ncbi:MarR family transcriptional regulator [Kallotenue papyrolyticum]|uniref:MarR family transcriptional regulator n=1 Tax=Kallotenue papyrolyticum TaxID=1325125 RepID=UPI0004BC51D7|nr:MarR family transcriptional regulator [Kallotenue papyrolyticum]